MAPGLAQIQSRLTTTQTLLLERSRIVSLSLPPSASSTAQINRNLLTLRSDLTKLENELKIEAGGLSVGGSKPPRKVSNGDAQAIAEAWERYDLLVEMFEEDDVGREKAKALKRVKEEEVEDRSRDVPPTPSGGEEEDEDEDDVVGFQPPSDVKPFRDEPEEEDDQEDNVNHHEMLAQQQQMMDDQDERLNLLSHSIGRQNHLSIQIGSELDHHHELLEDTDTAMDRTAARLHRARRNLDRVADEAKQHGSTITIVGLILILLILIIVFKT